MRANTRFATRISAFMAFYMHGYHFLPHTKHADINASVTNVSPRDHCLLQEVASHLSARGDPRTEVKIRAFPTTPTPIL